MLEGTLSLAFLVALNFILVAPATAEPLSISKTDSGKTESVVPAPLKEGMVTLQKRIDTLKQGGTGVAPFQKIYDEVESLANAGNTEAASHLMSDLGFKLSTQESLRAQAKRLGATRVVKVQQHTSAAAASSPPGAENMNNLLMGKIGCARGLLNKAQAILGSNAGGYNARIDAAEKLSATQPWAAITELSNITADIEKAAEAGSAAAGRKGN